MDCKSHNTPKHFHTSAKRSRFYDINHAIVLAFRSIGRSYSAAQKFCSIANLPNPVGKKPWTRHTQAILKAEIISSLKFLDSFEPAALSFEVFRLLRVPDFPLPFERVLYVVFWSSPFLLKRRELEQEDGYAAMRNNRICLEMK